MSNVNKLSKSIKPDAPKVRTGTLVSYVGSYATVNIDGAELLLPMLDSVNTSVPVGSIMVVQVFAGTGYVIGSLNNTDRAPSGAFTGSYANAPVPKPSNLGFSYTNFSPRQVGTYSVGVIPFVLNSTSSLSSSGGSETAAFWFYGTNAFSSLVGKTLQSVEVYVSPLQSANDSYPLSYVSHTSATRPSTTFSYGAAGSQNASQSGWVTLPSGFVTELGSNLNNWGVGFQVNGFTQTASQRASAPYGTIRVGWTN
jgi:hypothetical protein